MLSLAFAMALFILGYPLIASAQVRWCVSPTHPELGRFPCSYQGERYSSERYDRDRHYRKQYDSERTRTYRRDRYRDDGYRQEQYRDRNHSIEFGIGRYSGRPYGSYRVTWGSGRYRVEEDYRGTRIYRERTSRYGRRTTYEQRYSPYYRRYENQRRRNYHQDRRYRHYRYYQKW